VHIVYVVRLITSDETYLLFPLLFRLLLLQQPAIGCCWRCLTGRDLEKHKTRGQQPRVFVFQRRKCMAVRGVRGATVIVEDREDLILSATRELLLAIQEANPTMQTAEVGSIFFTVSDDISATYPALAARQLGWTQVPMLCAREIPVPNSLRRCIRILLHWNTELSQEDIHHVYLGEAASLRPDLSVIS
jgi:chorismate mutase